jgi:hypothetical protein
MRAVSNKYAYDIMEEELNSGPDQLVDIIKARRSDAWGDLLDLIESYFWAANVTPEDELTPWPLRHTLLQHGTLGDGTAGATTAAGYNRQNPTGWTNKEGQNALLWRRWNNWTAGWNDMTDLIPGFIYRLDEAMSRTRFQAPYPYPNTLPEELDRGFYTNYQMIELLKQWRRRNNDNIGQDPLGMRDDVIIRGTPVMWVEDFDVDAHQPFVAVDWNAYEVLQSPGWDFKEIGPRPAPLQPTAIEVHVYKMYNVICKDPSRNFYLNQYTDLSGAGLTTSLT